MQPDIMHPVLEYYYENVQTLRSYLAACLPADVASQLVQPLIDGDSYVALLQNSHVAWNASAGAPKAFEHEDARDIDITWLIHRVQLEILKSAAKANNVLCFGYRLSEGNLTNQFSNTSLTDMQEHHDWKELLLRCGTGAFCHLIKYTSVFAAVPNYCCRQVSGFPVYELLPLSVLGQKRDVPTKDNCSTSNKRVKPLSAVQKLANPSDVLINRSAIYYADLTKSKVASSGLSSNHILNTLFVAFPEAAHPEYAHDQAASRHLSKHIWKAQYDIVVNVRSYGAQREALDMAIMANGPVSTPARLGTALLLLQQMYINHRSIDYEKLRDKLCPSTLQKKKLSDEEKSMLLDIIAEDSQAPLTQAELDSGTTHDPDQSLEQSRLHILASNSNRSKASEVAKDKPRFAEFVISQYQVTRFVQACVEKIVPAELVGSEKNMKVLLGGIEKLICARKFESFSVHQILQGVSTTDCAWLATQKSARARPTVTDSAKRRELLEELFRWIFEDLVIDLLRTNFYITESAVLQRKTLYFLQTDWLTICQPLLDNMAKTLFRKMQPDEATAMLEDRHRKLGFSHVRLLPKEKGVRPIVNLSRKPAVQANRTYPLSINQLLQDTFSVLNYEKQRHDELLRSSVQATSDIYTQLKSYKKRIGLLAGERPRLYMVKLDIRACFDSIKQDKLLSILETILSEPDYTISRYVSMVKNRHKPLRKFAREARASDDFLDFPELAFQLADSLRKAVFVDQVRNSSSKRTEVLKMLKEHVEDNIVKIGSQYYRQVLGIPQGSVLSTLLCNYFYGHLERQELGFLKSDENLLLRLVDDFLLITTKRDIAERFVRKMHEGHPEYGCFISVDKTLVNFDISADGVQALKKVGEKMSFAWCGYMLNQRTLDVQYEYARFQATHIGNTLCVKTFKRPGETFVNAMIQAFKMRSHLIYHDLSFTSSNTAYTNVYQSFQLVAMKYHAYIKTWKPNMEKNMIFFLNVIHRIVHYGFLAIRSWFDFKVAKDNNASLNGLRKGYVTWLGYRAFLLVLSRKPTSFRVILQHLRQMCQSKGSEGMKRELQPVLSHASNAELRKIQY